MNLKGIILGAFCAYAAISSAATKPIPDEVLRLIPSNIDLEKPEYLTSKKELGQLIAQCGPGVVKGAADARGENLRNACSFQVEMDDLFFENAQTKTGLLINKNWAYEDGVQWFLPLKTRSLPNNFDLRDLMPNGAPEIKKQQCGDCWAWSTHHGLEIARAVHDGKPVDHSVQTVLSCSGQGSCSGGYMSAVDFLLHGLPEESEFPYAGYDKRCKYNSAQISQGWDPKMLATPYVGDSKRFSLAKFDETGSFKDGTQVEEMMQAMYDAKGPLVVTVAAYNISGPGIYNYCSAINSGGNHMVAVVGWDTENGKRNAHVWNSWGKSHGDNGVSRIQWECGQGRLNRGLGVSAKVVQYKPSCVAPSAGQKYLHEIKSGDSVQIGVDAKPGITCHWTPSAGLSDPESCNPTAKPSLSTEYHLSATNGCGTSSSMTLVSLWGSRRGGKNKVLTPYGVITLNN
jgi:Papain family cysteine protease